MPSAGCDIGQTEERIFKKYNAIKLPQSFIEDNRGLNDCCCELLVLGSSSTKSWESDKSSAWIKLSDPSDTFTFQLFKNGVLSNYQPLPNAFVNEPNAWFTTINWGDVIQSDGVGCYTLKIEYSISGVIGALDWATYTLKQYTIANALGTARLRAQFDGYQEKEGINFSASNIVTDIRFYGFIGNSQPNMEIDNIIYGNREMKRVIRENLYSYEITTDPLGECIIKPIVDLFLLSENQLFISDYNAHNYSYRYQDLAVIVEESPEIEYYDFSRKAKLKAKVSDKFKNSRTYY